MADKQQDNGPYTVYGRRTPNEQEVQLGSHDDLDRCKRRADDMVDSGMFHQATVRDKNDQTVHVGLITGEKDQRPDNDQLPPAA